MKAVLARPREYASDEKLGKIARALIRREEKGEMGVVAVQFIYKKTCGVDRCQTMQVLIAKGFPHSIGSNNYYTFTAP